MNICIPTLNSYESLWKCVDSIGKEHNIFIIDNGGRLQERGDDNVIIYHQHINLGVAASWNWFIDYIPQPRIITNDDIVFHENAIVNMIEVADEDHLFFPENLENAFSCYYLPDKIINTVGKFDEAISPNYGYFEDNDYQYRMLLQNFWNKRATGCFVDHIGSSTLKNHSPMEMESHHRKFRAARDRYIRKWGGEPNDERYKTPYNR